MKARAHRSRMPWKVLLAAALGLASSSGGCADSKRAHIESATVDGNRQDAGDADAGAEPASDECPRTDREQLELEPNDSAGQAQRVQPCVVHKVLGTPDGADADQDWFKVRVPEGVTSLSVTITALRGTGPELWILRAEDQPIEHHALPAGDTLTITTGVTGGEYFIRTRTGAGSEHELFVELSNVAYEIEESNDEPATAETIAFDTTYSAHDSALGTGVDFDWFRLEVPEGAHNLTIEIEDLGEDDPIESELWLVREGAATIEHRVLRGGESTAATIGVEQGEYFVRVVPGEQRAYALRAVVGVARFELEECNDVAETARHVELGASYDGQDSALAGELDWDWFRIAVPAGVAGMTIRLNDIVGETDPDPESGTALWVYRSADNLIEHRMLGPDETADLQIGVVEGEYLLNVLVGEGHAYTLTVAASDMPFELEESNDQRETAPLIEPGVTYAGQGSALDTEDEDQDWFRVVAPDGASSMMVTLTDIGSGQSALPELVAYDASAIQVGYLAPRRGDSASESFRIGGASEHAVVVRSGRGRPYRLVITF